MFYCFAAAAAVESVGAAVVVGSDDVGFGVGFAAAAAVEQLRRQPLPLALGPVDELVRCPERFYFLASVFSFGSHLFAWREDGSHREACSKVHRRCKPVHPHYSVAKVWWRRSHSWNRRDLLVLMSPRTLAKKM